MAHIDDVYQELTGVNIQTQQVLWDERGKGYYGEYLVFKELYVNISGCCKILMNLQIPAGNGKTTEIDLLLIHETGLHVFEMKHYKGTIYGKSNEQKWTQYFRTSPNSHFYNPIRQNQYHINALRKMFPGIPIHSYIVFTSPECDLRIQCDDQDITVCQLSDLYIPLFQLEASDKIFDIEHINSIFSTLSVYSPITDKSVVVDGETIPFHQYIDAIIKDYHDEKEKAKNTYLIAEKAEKKKTLITIVTAAIVVVACIIGAIMTCVSYRTYSDEEIAAAKQELSEFAQKFDRVDDYNNGEIVLSKEVITVSDVQLEDSIDLENTVSFSCSLTWNGSDYGISIGKNAVLIAILKDGSIKECPIYNSSYSYTSDYRLGKPHSAWYTAYSSGDIPRHEFYDISIEDISYIKLANLDIWIRVGNRPTIIASDYELELYRAD